MYTFRLAINPSSGCR